MSKAKDAIPQLSTNEKLEQIRSGRKLERRKSQMDVKDTVMTGKDGSKIIQKKMTEKYEETTVKRRKNNYVMYESKLGTEENTQIRSIAKPKPKPKSVSRTPGPRREEKIITVKKRKEYLDNYQYHETKVLRKNKKPSLVIHKRLDSAPNIFESSSKYQTVTIENSGRTNPKLRVNKPEKIKQPSATTTDFYKKPGAQTATNFYKKPIVTNDRGRKNETTTKSEVVTRQIISRRNQPQTKDGKTEVVTNSTITTSSTRTRGRVQTPANNTPGNATMVITKETIEQKGDNERGTRRKYQEIKVKVHSRRGRRNEDKENTGETKEETKEEKKEEIKEEKKEEKKEEMKEEKKEEIKEEKKEEIKEEKKEEIKEEKKEEIKEEKKDIEEKKDE